MKQQPIVFFWFRRDLRLDDNAGLYRALRCGYPVLPVFIFDKTILDQLPVSADARVEFIHQSLQNLQQQLAALGSTLVVRHGSPAHVWQTLFADYPQACAIYTNKDYESYAQGRDAAIAALAEKQDIAFHAFKDHVIFEGQEVVKKDGTPYSIFTPYSRVWNEKVDSKNGFYLRAYPCHRYWDRFMACAPALLPTLASLGFHPTGIPIPSSALSPQGIKEYAQQRDYPHLDATSKLGIHLRFGTVSIRALVRQAKEWASPVFVNELIWRDFYSMILSHFPQVERGAFQPKFDQIPWHNDPQAFEKWYQGRTGYPLVDAGMRQLNATGYMHNRVRMVVASFLSKHLLIDWRWGEAYFAQKLLDFDLASNNGGWQWAAGCGTDAAPYFRVFNPSAQQTKFDPKGAYILRWIPEYGTPAYPAPMVVHEFARKRYLDTVQRLLKTPN